MKQKIKQLPKHIIKLLKSTSKIRAISLKPRNLMSKILLGFSIILIIMLIFSVQNYFTSSRVHNETQETVDHQLPMLLTSEALAYNVMERVGLARAYVLFGEENYQEEYDRITEESKVLEEELISLDSSEETQELIKLNQKWEKAISDDIFTIYNEEENAELAKMNLRYVVKPLTDELTTAYKDLASTGSRLIKETGGNLLTESRSSVITGVIWSIVAVIAGVIVSFFVSKIITKPILMINNRMTIIASGDLSNEPLELNSKDEIGQLAESTNKLNQNMKRMLDEIKYVSNSVSALSEELNDTASDVREGSSQVATTMQEIASGAEMQADKTSDLATSMDSYRQRVQEVSERGDNVTEFSKHALSLSEKGGQLMDTSINQMSTIDRVVQDSVKKVKSLDEQSKRISKLIGVINDISNQTNLLALNATIEAARAGEHGKGFAVVANEVKKLSQQVSASVKDITEIVSIIQKESENVASSLMDGYSEVEAGTRKIKITGKTFQEINDALKNISQDVIGISENLEDMSTKSNEMSKYIEDIASVSEESSAGIEQTTASVQETSSSMEDVSNTSKELAKVAENLNNLMNQFRLK